MKDVIVVGCGILGATVSDALLKQGREVLTFDDGRPNSGTAPSGGHLKPSWFGGMKKKEYEPAMQLLDDLWGLKEEEFEVRAESVTKTTVFRVDTDVVMKFPRINKTVTGVSMLHNFPLVRWNGGEDRCRLLVVTTGVWANELVKAPTKCKQGVSFRLRGTSDPFISPWAPYKQVVIHQQRPGVLWAGDGSAIYPENWTKQRTMECLGRCTSVLDRPAVTVLSTTIGFRPYCKPVKPGDPCLFKQLGPRAWVATGAGKSGTIAAGWVARRLLNVG